MSVEAHIKDWISKISEFRPELGGFSVCPYASKAKYKIIECKAEDIMPISGYDVLFYVIEDYFDLQSVEFWVNYYNKKYPEYIFLEDHATSDSYINGVQTNNGKYNLILAQNREDLRKNRQKLATSGYYYHWNDEYLREILGNDYEMVKNSG
jgi:ssDNA-specific exonuclease RecJ